ncbi:DUF2252 family protein [Nocardioides marmorisolisilvae]|uniref:DUF2252 domain-containing protein n=1 Tax=Nocardioides marmorisolisilvae TaxID=1542737 RepID=A0A3N0E0Q5_9ACTN|nr:DUF2252 family protein [Nocardioides marmorisolisilvae]RNL81323.1 DUF2252 domain-containing protein [Nocardioides marmorisolisilvae]
MADPHELTHAFEDWLAARIPLERAELRRKHEEMRAHEYRFLRGGYHLWLARFGEELPELLTGTPVPVVGDLHVENFGTWRDRDQVRRWGVNDFDELSRGPVALDLVRLATSAVLAPHLALDENEVCAELLAAWSAAEPRACIDLAEEGAGHLRALVPEFADAARFYADLAAGPPEQLPDAVRAAAAEVAERGWAPTWHQHTAGTGSLGHRRVVGVGPAADGTPHAREAKQLGPGTAPWAAETWSDLTWPESDPGLYDEVRDAIRGPAAAARVLDWHVRDLAPDVVRIEVTGLGRHDSARLLRAMARATADVHGSGGVFASCLRDVARLGERRFQDAVSAMVARTKADFTAYRKKN